MYFSDFNLEQYLNELETVVNIDSGTVTPEGVAKVADFFKNKFEQIGCLTETFHFSPEIGPCVKIQYCIWSRNRGHESRRPVGLLCSQRAYKTKRT